MMTKSLLFFSALSMLILLPNWLQRSVSPSSDIPYRIPTTDQATIEALPASKTGITVVCDLSGVLLDIDNKQALDEIGLLSVMKYIATYKISPLQVKHDLLDKVYRILDTIQPGGNPMGAQDPYGNRMPSLMCDWQTGRKTNKKLISITSQAIKKNPQWFTSAIEKTLVEHALAKMFVPTQLVSSIVLIPEGLAFVKQCKEQGHTLLVLSNWDSESFALILKKFPELFCLFDGILTSGSLGHMKPELEAFEIIVKRSQRLHEPVVFIDDQEQNVISASRCGIHAIHHIPTTGLLGLSKKPHFETAEQLITTLKIRQTTPPPLPLHKTANTLCR